MKHALTIGLTGGIGTGKSLALAEFARLGARTVCLDEIAREVVRPGRPGHRRVVRAFGREFLRSDGTLDRPKLAAEVFARASSRRRLERVLHPLILREMERRVVGGKAPVVVDVPLLFEKKLSGRFDLTMLVAASPRAQLRRVCRRDGATPEEARARIAAQLPLKEKRRLADVTIDNDGTRAALRGRVRDYYNGFLLMGRS